MTITSVCHPCGVNDPIEGVTEHAKQQRNGSETEAKRQRIGGETEAKRRRDGRGALLNEPRRRAACASSELLLVRFEWRRAHEHEAAEEEVVLELEGDAEEEGAEHLAGGGEELEARHHARLHLNVHLTGEAAEQDWGDGEGWGDVHPAGEAAARGEPRSHSHSVKGGGRRGGLHDKG